MARRVPGQDLVAGEDGKVLVGEQENRLGRVWGRRSEKISVGGRRLRLGGRRESTAHTGPRGGLLKHGHPGHPRAGAQATRGKRIGRRGRPRRIVPPSTPARLLLGGEAPNTMPPALCCFLLGHGAQLDRPLGMPTRDWLPPNYTALQMWMLLTFFLPVHPEHGGPSPPLGPRPPRRRTKAPRSRA